MWSHACVNLVACANECGSVRGCVYDCVRSCVCVCMCVCLWVYVCVFVLVCESAYPRACVCAFNVAASVLMWVQTKKSSSFVCLSKFIESKESLTHTALNLNFLPCTTLLPGNSPRFSPTVLSAVPPLLFPHLYFLQFSRLYCKRLLFSDFFPGPVFT